MQSNKKRIYISFFLLLLALPALACGSLFSDPEEERAEENEPLTGDVEFGDVVMAEGIGGDNEPLQETDTFSTSQDVIYVVAETNYIEAGTTMFARWYRDGEPFEDSANLEANQDYTEPTYVEFHLENLEAEFEEGDYSVTIFVNGNPTVEETFTIE